MSTEPKQRYPEIDQELVTVLGKSKSELSFMYHFHRAQLLIARKVEDKDLAREVIDELELFRESLIREMQKIHGNGSP